MTDLAKLVEARLGPPPAIKGGRPFWFCPFHKEKTPSFGVTSDDRHVHCFGCLRSMDDVDFVRALDGVSFAEAFRIARGCDPEYRLGGGAGQGYLVFRPSPVDRSPGDPPPVGWSERFRVVSNYCHRQLFDDAGRVGLEWLQGRGLTVDTIKAWRLGWNDRERYKAPAWCGLQGGKRIWLPRGVTIPWVESEIVRCFKIRRFGANGPLANGEQKYAWVRGGQPTFYGLDFITGRQVVTLVEGELDAPLLWQQAGDLVDVLGVGAKGRRVPVEYLARLLEYDLWLVALDNDADDAAQVWLDYAPCARRMKPQSGNDITDSFQAGGNLRAWVRFHLDRAGLEL